MRTRLEIIQNSIDFLKGFDLILDVTSQYNTEKLVAFVKSIDNRYLQNFIEFLENYDEYEITGEHLSSILQVVIESKKELLNILKGIE